MKRKERVLTEKITKQNTILQSAMKVFAKKGYEQTTMDDIAKEAGFAKASLYFYFKRKEDLFLMLIKTGLSQKNDDLKNILSSNKSAIKKLKEVIETSFDFFYTNKDFIKIFHSEIHRLYKREQEEINRIFIFDLHETLNIISLLFKQGIKEKIFRKINSELAALNLMGVISIIIGRLVHFDENIPLNEYKRGILDLILKGVEK